MTPTLTIGQSAWNTSTGKSVAASWNAGDYIFVLGMVENNDTQNLDLINTPTATGLTFIPLDLDITEDTGSHCWGGSWYAVASGSGSGNISASLPGGVEHFGILVVVASGSGGIGAHTRINDASQTTSVTLGGPNSAVLELIGDWSASSTSGHTYTPSGATDQVAFQDNAGGSHYTVYGATWTNKSAGTASYGVSVSGSAMYTKVIVEVKGTSAPVGLGWIAGINNP